jgi:hypothetical protein
MSVSDGDPPGLALDVGTWFSAGDEVATEHLLDVSGLWLSADDEVATEHLLDVSGWADENLADSANDVASDAASEVFQVSDSNAQG